MGSPTFFPADTWDVLNRSGFLALRGVVRTGAICRLAHSGLRWTRARPPATPPRSPRQPASPTAPPGQLARLRARVLAS